ncbi:hypothetical protein BJ508DRAFT_331227 [Ascobolus immersus RN42]|uniref:Uncharacterized protein n=1 Tax=Ascobolus immersus RN42 TaxID=1160509 RepID=A0A3N4HSI8_ASCIM|nr:hypothetical protein BJ508DRAFT_331227 [Ascobolus immersus RN42]
MPKLARQKMIPADQIKSRHSSNSNRCLRVSVEQVENQCCTCILKDRECWAQHPDKLQPKGHGKYRTPKCVWCVYDSKPCSLYAPEKFDLTTFMLIRKTAEPTTDSDDSDDYEPTPKKSNKGKGKAIEKKGTSGKGKGKGKIDCTTEKPACLKPKIKKRKALPDANSEPTKKTKFMEKESTDGQKVDSSDSKKDKVDKLKNKKVDKPDTTNKLSKKDKGKARAVSTDAEDARD